MGNSPHPLEYSRRAGPRGRTRASTIIAFIGFWGAIFGWLLVPEYLGSGIPRPDPVRMLVVYWTWGLALAYVWRRLSEEPTWPSAGGVIMLVGAWTATIAVPVQIIVWREDAGFPRSRFRPELMLPLMVAAIGLLFAVLGRLISRLCRRIGSAPELIRIEDEDPQP